ncbi:MAG: GNAT family N-acetyltransferase [Pseudolabrys sp.]
MTPVRDALIRPARPDEAGRLAEIARAAYAKYVPRMGREPAPMTADYAAAIAAGHAVVIARADAVLGYLIGCVDGDAWFIENIAVDPACQGEGLGATLLRHAMTEARRQKLTALWLFTNAAMTENLAIYARLGFVETHRAVEHGYNRVYMRLSL